VPTDDPDPLDASDEHRLRQRLDEIAEERMEIIKRSLRFTGYGASWLTEEIDAEEDDIRRRLGMELREPARKSGNSVKGWMLLAAAVALIFAVIWIASTL
jgi:hypothetical protein